MKHKIIQKTQSLLHHSYVSLVLDDEKYFTFDNSHMPGNDNYYSDNNAECPENVRYVGKEKYPKKILVAVAISSKRVSRPLFRPTKSCAINSVVYMNGFLEPIHLPFINEHHSDEKYLFWPYLASAHYFYETQKWMNRKVKYVPKHLNPPNVPQARLIENF